MAYARPEGLGKAAAGSPRPFKETASAGSFLPGGRADRRLAFSGQPAFAMGRDNNTPLARDRLRKLFYQAVFQAGGRLVHWLKASRMIYARPEGLSEGTALWPMPGLRDSAKALRYGLCPA